MHDLDSWYTYCHMLMLAKATSADGTANESDDATCACARLLAHES